MNIMDKIIMTNHEQYLELVRLMREGCKKTRPIQGMFYSRSKYDEFTCALGAIHYAFNLENISKDPNLFRKKFPVLSKTRCFCSQIAAKNDSGVYTREEIANWLETLE